ncbi:MAG: thioredoxin family protein [Betaproteobacteria bacterium]|nr:thioredoxin family protein [Betaproteobacteria bacterium]
MAYIPTYSEEATDRAEVDALNGAVLIEFGANWCGHCQGAQPLIEAAQRAYPGLRALKIEDGSGRPLGRSFRVKLWPTLIFMKDGVELERLVRPGSEAEISAALARLTA